MNVQLNITPPKITKPHKPSNFSHEKIQTLHRPNGAIYKGEVLNGFPHGRGTMIYKNG
jgi:hypothetical protein